MEHNDNCHENASRGRYRRGRGRKPYAVRGRNVFFCHPKTKNEAYTFLGPSFAPFWVFSSFPLVGSEIGWKNGSRDTLKPLLCCTYDPLESKVFDITFVYLCDVSRFLLWVWKDKFRCINADCEVDLLSWICSIGSNSAGGHQSLWLQRYLTKGTSWGWWWKTILRAHSCTSPSSQRVKSSSRGTLLAHWTPESHETPYFFHTKGLNGFPKCGKMNRLDEEGPLMTLPS